MEVPEASEQIGNFVPTSSVTFSMFMKFAEIHDPEEARMRHQAKLAHRLRKYITRRFLDEGHSGSADCSNRKSSTPGSSDGKSGTADSSTPRFAKTTPVELRMYEDHRVVKLTHVVAIHPMVGERGHGTLEAHENGFIYKASGFRMVFMNANVKTCFWRPGDKWPPLLQFNLQHPIMVEKQKRKDIQFFLMPTPGQDPMDSDYIGSRDEDLKRFVHGVEETHWNHWSDVPITPISFQALEEYEFHGVFPTGKLATFALTYSALVGLEGRPFFVIPLGDIEIVNLALLQPEVIDMTVVFKDFKCSVLEIHSIPSKFLTDIKHRLNFAFVKYYVNKESTNWKVLVRNTFESPERLRMFIHKGGWESLGLEDSRTLAYYPGAGSGSDFLAKYDSCTLTYYPGADSGPVFLGRHDTVQL